MSEAFGWFICGGVLDVVVSFLWAKSLQVLDGAVFQLFCATRLVFVAILSHFCLHTNFMYKQLYGLLVVILGILIFAVGLEVAEKDIFFGCGCVVLGNLVISVRLILEEKGYRSKISPLLGNGIMGATAISIELSIFIVWSIVRGRVEFPMNTEVGIGLVMISLGQLGAGVGGAYISKLVSSTTRSLFRACHCVPIWAGELILLILLQKTDAVGNLFL